MLRDHVDGGDLLTGRASRAQMVNCERADKHITRVADWRTPTCSQTMRESDEAGGGPERIRSDVRHVDGSVEKSRGPARTCGRTDLRAVDHLAIVAREAGCGGMPQALSIRIKQQDRGQQ